MNLGSRMHVDGHLARSMRDSEVRTYQIGQMEHALTLD